MVRMPQIASQYYNYTYQTDVLQDLIDLEEFDLNSTLTNATEPTRRLQIEPETVPQFRPIGDRLVELTYPVDMALTVLSMLKIYLVFRAIMWQTLKLRYNFGQSDQKVYNLYKSQNHGSYGGFEWFQLKQEIKNRPFTFFILIFMLMVFYFSQIIRLCEIAGQQLLDNGNDWRYMWNSVYFTIQVITSVGYGDYYP